MCLSLWINYNLQLYLLKRFKKKYTFSILKHLFSSWFVFRKNFVYIKYLNY